MPNIFHQSIEDILKAATPEQKIIWNDIFLRFGERCAVSQFQYTGPGGELLTYVARKIYFAITIINNNSSPGAGFSGLSFYDENNILNFNANFMNVYWDATAAAVRHLAVPMKYENFLFSRLALNGTVTQIRFIGYRITY